jgi:hypothetical protein
MLSDVVNGALNGASVPFDEALALLRTEGALFTGTPPLLFFPLSMADATGVGVGVAGTELFPSDSSSSISMTSIPASPFSVIDFVARTREEEKNAAHPLLLPANDADMGFGSSGLDRTVVSGTSAPAFSSTG